jgi:multiple sugar transport system substrate-binding protein
MISQGPSVCIFNKEDPQVVLASWLFAQYLTSNDVQIAYSQTEGYVPVTLKAQTSEEYQDYLSRMGEDNNLHYDVKIKAAKLLIDNVQYTFVTPVFNGSTSLRDAAGQLIEDVTKAVRRKKTVDDAYLDALFDDVTALYRLDQTTGMAGGSKEDMGPLPTASKALLAVLAVTWVLIGTYFVRDKIRKSHGS